jgi:hypothetical protein
MASQMINLGHEFAPNSHVSPAACSLSHVSPLATFGVSSGIQDFFNTGLLGAVITTIVASLAWRIIASSFPIAFLSNPLIYVIIRLCLILEASGICSAAWLLALIHKQVAGYYQLDEVYVGTPEERAIAEKEGDDLELFQEEGE